MKELSKLHGLIHDLRKDGFDAAADKIQKKADEYYLNWSMSVKKKANDFLEEKEEESEEEREEPMEDDGPEDKGSDSILSFLAALKMNLAYSQTAHWVAKGDSSYGDHLLYERLYEENLEEIDLFAEKFIPIAGEKIVNPIELEKQTAIKLSEVISFNDKMIDLDIAENVLKAEEYVVKSITDLHTFLTSKDILTIGAEDLITEICSTHENHCYLLKQRLK
jgi:DNA-binding ferritin-like protein